MKQPWSNCPRVFIVAPHCPACLGNDLLTIRCEQNGDGSVTRKTVCRTCSSRFLLIVEPPSAGNGERLEC